MANQGFIRNKHLGPHLKAIWLASMNLSLGDYQILNVYSKNKDELPSIEIDRKLEIEGLEYKEHQIAEKRLTSTVNWGVRIFWKEV